MFVRRLLPFVALMLAFSASLPVHAQTCTGKLGVPGRYDLTIKTGGYDRTYHVVVPSSYQSTRPIPLLFGFHGLGDTGLNFGKGTKLDAKAESAGFIAVFPDGYENSWNAGSCCPPASTKQIDDVQFTRDMIKQLSADYCIDAARIFVTGFSNGGYMTQRLGCEATNQVAAIAPASGIIAVQSCLPPRPVPVIETQGTADPIVPYKRGKASNDYWVAYNGCGASSTVYQNGGATCIAYNNCQGGATVEWCEVKGMGHDWPSSSGNPGWLDATDTFWEFFTKHPMP